MREMGHRSYLTPQHSIAHMVFTDGQVLVSGEISMLHCCSVGKEYPWAWQAARFGTEIRTSYISSSRRGRQGASSGSTRRQRCGMRGRDPGLVSRRSPKYYAFF